MTDQVSMTIGGNAVTTSRSFEVVDPATGAPFATAPECTTDQLDQAMQSAQDAYRTWKQDESARRTSLLVAAEAVLAATDTIAPLLTREQGKPLADSQMEVRSVALWLRHFAGLEVGEEILQDDNKAHIRVQRRPLGVVAAITPWNFPLSLAAWKIAPALRAGNTMVLKPSPYTPLATLLLGRVLAEVLPAGVLNVVSGSDPLGAHMTQHPVPRKISFTGSVATGKHVAAAAAPDLKRITLELGGNDPAILLDDVDVEAVAERLFWSAFRNNGQVCSAVKRVYAPQERYDEVVEALASVAGSVRVGAGSDPESQLGPLNNAPQLERVAGLVDDAVSRGGQAVVGGAVVDGPGFFYQPTILRGVADGMAVVDEEQFGPVLPVLPYRSVDEAVERANGTHFGLSGSVWGTDADRAAAVADELDCGTAWVNTHLALRPDQPFGGAKWSGIGVENGHWGLHSFTEVRVLHRSHA
ncbi:acyl-CoA reductase-like NAD-dependent aldehyde dehydrogenase [Streptomyces sp. SAI-133]|jgi:acyl-CoA reductase-like NAD-dependent aldehyde dehydrogenase|uniref:aldehyde dehydrogenase family protein n=1 Tax=unclassified Streptomyces TaxID=2593676 RepID=UPI0024730C71|nr:MULTISPECIES: aldehyde dehydrogenase family protein [unclassified Streptomyces]MDH6554414.1 acyl-CoA reductase-like NAD-dependent aldehyde dehydrogenase [Streptomyces sp. SAI-041]MDH6581587.1 acyl-CoA reductase-like NAD-dependent aldehyde dehydrogenase [Streptomyces sp. SAI-133]